MLITRFKIDSFNHNYQQIREIVLNISANLQILATICIAALINNLQIRIQKAYMHYVKFNEKVMRICNQDENSLKQKVKTVKKSSFFIQLQLISQTYFLYFLPSICLCFYSKPGFSNFTPIEYTSDDMNCEEQPLGLKICFIRHRQFDISVIKLIIIIYALTRVIWSVKIMKFKTYLNLLFTLQRKQFFTSS